MWSLVKKLFAQKNTNETMSNCNHDMDDSPSTTRVVLIMCSVALLIFSVGYTLRPVSTIVREISEPELNINKNHHSNTDIEDLKT